MLRDQTFRTHPTQSLGCHDRQSAVQAISLSLDVHAKQNIPDKQIGWIS